MPVPSDREIVHVLPRHYVVDGQDGIKNPIGMLGHRIEVQTTIVSGAMTSVHNLVRWELHPQTTVTHRFGLDAAADAYAVADAAHGGKVAITMEP